MWITALPVKKVNHFHPYGSYLRLSISPMYCFTGEEQLEVSDSSLGVLWEGRRNTLPCLTEGQERLRGEERDWSRLYLG